MNSSKIAMHVLAELSEFERQDLLDRAEDDMGDLVEQASAIADDVIRNGDEALVRYAAKFDKAELSIDKLVVDAIECQRAREAISPELFETLQTAAGNIRAFHERQLPEPSWMHEFAPGVTAGERHLPIANAACYVPGGKESFPSVALMTVIPAAVAGVEQIVVLTPPRQDGTADPAVVTAATLAGAHMIVKAGGVQAFAAAAFGTESVPRCDKIEGPGSLWVAAARRALATVFDTGLPAGPSESIVLADETADPKLAALDLLIESEHGPDSSAFLVTWSKQLALDVQAAIPGYWQKMDATQAQYSATVLGGDSGGIVLAADAAEAYEFINEYAPEHLQIMSEKPDRHLEHIVNAAEILLGRWTPGSIANYMLGPSCVLPTASAAVTRSPLSVRSFMKTSSVARLDEQGYRALAPHVHRFASYEGFSAHANAVSAMRDDASGEKGS